MGTPRGRATSADVVGYSQGYSELWASVGATFDPFTDVFTNGEVGDTVLTGLADTSDAVIDRRYWIKSSTGGLGHEIEIIDVPGPNSVQIAAPLRAAFASGIIEGHRLTRTITETTAIWRDARAQWTLTYGTTQQPPKSTWFDIVPLPLTLWDVEITEYDLETREPQWGEEVDAAGGWRKLVAGAFSDLWQEINQGHKPDLLRSRDMLKDPLIYRTLYHRFRADEVKKLDYLAKYEKAMAQCTNSTEAWYDSMDALLKSYFGLRRQQVGNDFVYYECDDEAGLLADNRSASDGWNAPNRMLVT